MLLWFWWMAAGQVSIASPIPLSQRRAVPYCSPTCVTEASYVVAAGQPALIRAAPAKLVLATPNCRRDPARIWPVIRARDHPAMRQ